MDTVVDGPTPSEAAAKEKSDHNHHPNGTGACAGISGETGVKSPDVVDLPSSAKPELKPTKDDKVSPKKAEEESKLVPKSEFSSVVTTNGINLNGESLVQVSPSDISDTKTMEPPVRSDFGEKVSEEVTPAAVPKETVVKPAETKDLEPEISPVMSNGLESHIQTEVQSETVVVDGDKSKIAAPADILPIEEGDKLPKEEEKRVVEISPSSQVPQTEQKSPEPFKDVQPTSDTKPKAEIEPSDSKILPEDSSSSQEPPAKVEATETPALPVKTEKKEVETTKVETPETCQLEAETGVHRYPSTESLPESKAESDKKETTEAISVAVISHEEIPLRKTPEVEKEEAKVESSHVEVDLKAEPAKIPELDVVETSKCKELHVSSDEKSLETTPEPSPADVPDHSERQYAKPDLLAAVEVLEEPVTITESPLKSPQGLDSKVVDESVSEIKSTKEDLTHHLEAEHEASTSSRDAEPDKISLVSKQPEPDVAAKEVKLEAVDVSERKKSIEIESVKPHEYQLVVTESSTDPVEEQMRPDEESKSSTDPVESPAQQQMRPDEESKVETDSDVSLAAEVVKHESEQVKIPETPAAADISESTPTISPEQPQVTSVQIDSESQKDHEIEVDSTAEHPSSIETDQKPSAHAEEAETKAITSPQVEPENLKVEAVTLTRAESPEPPPSVPSEPKVISTVDVVKEEIKEDETSTDDISEKKSSVVEAEIKTEPVIEKDEEEIKVSLTSELTSVSTEAEIAVIDGQPEAQTSLNEDKLKGEQPSLSPAENVSEVAMATVDGDGALNVEETVLLDSTKTPDDETIVDKEVGEIKKEMELNEIDVEKGLKEEMEETKESPGEKVIFTNEFQRSLPLRHEIEETPVEQARRGLAAEDATPSPLDGAETSESTTQAETEADAETKCSWDDIRMKDDEIEVVATSMDVEEPIKVVVEESPTAGEPPTADGTELAPVEELPEPSQVENKDGDHDSGVDESTQGKDGVEESPSKKPTTLTSTPASAKGPPKKSPTPKKSPSAPVTASPAKIQKGPSSVSSQGSTTQEKKVPMNKVVVGTTPSPNLKVVKSKIGSLENAHHKAGGGNVKLETKKVDITGVKSKIGSTDNIQHKPLGGDKKILSRKLDWKVQSKVGSLDNTAHKPGGGTKKIETQKLTFKDAKPKVGSLDNRQHKPGGGQLQIEEHKLNFKDKAKSKVGSMDNVTHKAGGGTVQIFDEKLYFKQHSDEDQKKDSQATSPSPQPHGNESAENGLVDEAKSPVSAETMAK